jgi:flagellar basal body P-ring formation protein FlgA
MRRFLFRFFVGILLTMSVKAYGLSSAVTIRLSDKATSVGPGILFSEISDISGENKVLLEKIRRLAVGRAAPAGEEMKLTQSYLKIVLRKEGYSTNDIFFEGAESVEVLTDSQEFSPEDILSEARAFILQNVKEVPENIEVKLLGVPKKMLLPAGKIEPHFKMPLSGKLEGPVLLMTELDVNGHLIKTLPLRVMVEVFRSVIVTKKSIEKDERFTTENVGMVRTPTSKLFGEYLYHLNEVLGRKAAVPLMSGTALKLSSLYDPPIIKQGQMVQATVQYGNVEIAVQVRAVENGKTGDVIRVENTDTHKLLRAKVLDEKSVLVEQDRP